MCGIIGYVGKKYNAKHVLIDGLKALEYRGYDSAGIALVMDNKVFITREVGKIVNLEKLLNDSDTSSIGIGHTRWATHGEPSVRNSHPHKVGKITLVHNGIIENYESLKSSLIEDGYTFNSDTDTEVASALIDKLYREEKDMLKVIDKLKNLLRGSYALGILCDDELDTLYAVRKDSPLIVALDGSNFFIASDVPAILKYTNKYMLLENNEIVKMNENLTIYDEKLNVICKPTLEFSGSFASALKNGYEHFMLKEINEEGKVIEDTCFPYIEFKKESLLSKMPSLDIYKKIDIVACGSAYHTGLVGAFLIEKYADIPCNVCIASEYRYKKQFYNKDTLLIVVSQSGETADTLACLRHAKEHDMDTLAIVNVVGSSIAREAKYVLYIKAGCEIAVATTKAYSAQLAMFMLIATNIGVKKGLISDSVLDEIIIDIYKLPNLIQKTIAKDYTKIAKKIYKHNDIFFLGRGIDYALALEGSLKLKEISYLHCEAYAAGELKHGSIALITKNTPVISVVTDKSIFEKTISNIKEVKARGAYSILITTLNKEFDCADDVIVIDELHEMVTSILTIIPMQLIAYEVAKLNGCDIDKPRNLAKSVTVE